MSVSNIVRSDRDVRLVTDTCTYCGKAPVQFNRKVTLRPDARLALTLRGRHWIGVGFAELSERWEDFDTAVDDSIKIMPEIAKMARERGGDAGEGYELTVAGWQDGPKLTRLVYSATRQTVDRYDLDRGVYLAPSLGRQELPVDMSDDALARIALVQQTLSRKHGLNMCIGGDVELTTVSEHGVEIRKLGEYPDKAMMLHRIAQAPAVLAERAVA